MSKITTFEDLQPLLGQFDLLDFDILLDNKMACDIFQYAKSKGIKHDNIHLWFKQLLKSENINWPGTVAKLHRLKKQASKLRGEKKRELYNKPFEVPECTKIKKKNDNEDSTYKRIASDIALEMGEKLEKEKICHKKEVSILKRKLETSKEESEQKIKKLRFSQTKELGNLQEKIGQKKQCIKKLQYGRKISSTRQKRSLALISKLKKDSCKILRDSQSSKTYMKNLEIENKCLKSELEKLQQSTQEDGMCTDNQDNVIVKLKKELTEAVTDRDYLTSLLSDDSSVRVFENNSYTPEFRQVVMKITDQNVATSKIVQVINDSLSLVGKCITPEPSRKTIDNIVTEKIAVSQIQVGRELKLKENTTLYSDETRKFGRTYNSFLLSDEDKNVYCLGLREMSNKSSTTTLDTFKEVLADISNVCDNLFYSGEISHGHHILCKIRDFMSDRAHTNTAFTNLLIEYRKEIMPLIVDSWDALSDEKKAACTRINNFFCGLHLLVNFAECSAPILKEFENLYDKSGDQNIPVSSTYDDDDIKKYEENESEDVQLSKSEAQVISFLRFCSKCFASGVDERNGCSEDFKTYCRCQNEKNNFLSFGGNRFNVIFLFGQIAFYHMGHILDFFQNKHGANNFVQKMTQKMGTSKLVQAQCKVLGLISKLVTAPLWRIIEENRHVLSMNKYYETLLNFFERNSKDATKFIAAEDRPFDEENLVQKDKMFEALVSADVELDCIADQVAQTLFLSYHKLLKTAMKEQLPGGSFYEVGDEIVKETRSVIPHNKLPERSFGILDFLVRYRPNATILTNEAFVMFSFNKTSEWLEALSKEEREKLLVESRKRGKEIRSKFRSRCEEIIRKRKAALKEKESNLQKRREALFKKKRKETSDILYYGLWQSKDTVDKILNSISKVSEKRKALTAQLRFRRHILKQTVKDSSIYNVSKKGKLLSIEVLIKNVKQLIEDAAKTDRQSERRTSKNPLLVGKKVKHTFNEGTFSGWIISIVPGFPDYYNIVYDCDLDTDGKMLETTPIYTYRLLDDYRAQKLEIIPDVLEPNLKSAEPSN